MDTVLGPGLGLVLAGAGVLGLALLGAAALLYSQWREHRLEVRRTRVLLAHGRWEKEMNRERRRQQRRRYLGGRK